VDRALQVFRDEAVRFSRDEVWRAKFDGEPEIAGVIGLGENAVNIRVLFRTQPGQQWAIAREFRRRIKTRLDLEHIDIPTPQRTIRIKSAADDQSLGRGLGAPAARVTRSGQRPPADVSPPADSHE
jgi:small conductance mechanosensitive channel